MLTARRTLTLSEPRLDLALATPPGFHPQSAELDTPRARLGFGSIPVL
jgi:hypothetical protein